MAKIVLELNNSGGGGGGGTVTSVGLIMPSAVFNVTPSNITSSGTFTVTFDNQNQNLVFASPASAPAGQPSFRSLVTADMPATALQGQFMVLLRNSTVPNSGVNQFIGVVADVGATSGFTTTESEVQSPCPYNITIQSLKVYRNNTASANGTVRIMSNGSPIGNALSITNGDAAQVTTQNQGNVAVAQDALLSIRASATGGSGALRISAIVILFQYA